MIRKFNPIVSYSLSLKNKQTSLKNKTVFLHCFVSCRLILFKKKKTNVEKTF